VGLGVARRNPFLYFCGASRRGKGWANDYSPLQDPYAGDPYVGCKNIAGRFSPRAGRGFRRAVFVGANNHSPSFSYLSPGDDNRRARRSEERAAIEETSRHSGLDPESSLSFKFSRPFFREEGGEFLRRFAPEVYDSGFRITPGMTRCWGFRRAWGLASPGGIRFVFSRRFAPEKWIGGLRPPYENHPAKLTPGEAKEGPQSKK
jgi:hypothetical protein